MTLIELLRLLKSRLVIVVALPVALALVCFGGMTLLSQPEYSATAKITVSGSVATVGGLADSVAAEKSDSKVTLKATTETASNSVSITATGADAQACISAANSAVSTTKSKVDATLENVRSNTTNASSASDISPSPLKYTAVAFLAGLFLAVCVVVVIDMIKRPVRDRDALEEAAGIPCLGVLGGGPAKRERLVAAVRLAGRGDEAPANSVCIVPAGNTKAAQRAATEITWEECAKGLQVVATSPLSAGAAAIYDARDADTTVIAVEEAVTSLTDMEDLLRELLIASVKPAGFVYQKAEKQSLRKLCKTKAAASIEATTSLLLL